MAADLESDEAIACLRARIVWRLFATRALLFGCGWLFAWGAFVLILRIGFFADREVLLWGLAGFAPVLAAAAWMARRCVPKVAALRAEIDSHWDSGGLFMAAGELELGGWRQTLRVADVPLVHWRAGRPLALFGIATSFTLMAFLAPSRFVVGQQGLEIGEDTRRVAAQIRILSEEKLLDPTRAEALERKLETLAREASGDDPARAWEALDHLEETTAKLAAEAAEAALQQTEQLTRTQMLAEGLDAAAADLAPGDLDRGMRELAEMAAEAASENDHLARHLGSEEQGSIAERKLSRRQLEKIAKSAGLGKEDIDKLLRKLRQAGLIDAQVLEWNEKLAGFKERQALADFLEKNAGDGKSSFCDAVDNFCGVRPGRGGIDRGRGDAPLFFGDPSSEDGTKFKDEVLPPGSLAGLSDSQLVGVSQSAPAAGKLGVAKPGALRAARSGGGSAVGATILPRHRAAVGRYFEKPE